METSTPLVNMRTHDLHRRTLMKNAMEVSPLRRKSLLQTPIVPLENVNDENERSSRRSLINMQRRLSNISHVTSPLNESNKFLGEQDMKDHFQICTKLFTENKITPKNAWKLHIIDLLKHITQKQGTDTLQVAGTSLDISAKVYSLRVDDIYSNGLKLADNMCRISDKPQELDQNDVEGETNKENVSIVKRKKKKKRLLAGEKTTVCKDPKSLEATLPKLDSVFFSTRIDAESSAIDNLLTNKLKMDHAGYKFMLLSDEKAWTDQPDPVVQGLDNLNRKRYPLVVNTLTNVQLCAPFNDFYLDKWNPDEEEKQLALQKSSFMEKDQEVMYDNDGIPIHELDGSIHDIFENPPNDPEDDIQSIHEEGVPQIRGEIENIVEFRPDLTNGMQKSEYSYNSVVTSCSGQHIDRIWAGPSHWKLKFIRRSTARFSGQVDQEKPVKSGRKRAHIEIEFDFDKDYDEIDISKKLKIKRKPPTVDTDKIIISIPDMSLINHINELMTKPGVSPMKKRISTDNQADYETDAYKYENPNDSQYCSQHTDEPQGEDRDDGVFENNDGCEDVEEHRMAQEEFLGENLVDAPETIPNSYVPYALQAKKMDMKKLKAAVWQNLTGVGVHVISNINENEARVVPTTFSKLYEELPALLPHKMQKELSSSLAFFALLHLCNEQYLTLTQHPNYKDFDIKKS